MQQPDDGKVRTIIASRPGVMQESLRAIRSKRYGNKQIGLVESSIVCFRTDDGNYGKFRVNDIRSTNGRLELE